jgi:hypothetical protein
VAGTNGSVSVSIAASSEGTAVSNFAEMVRATSKLLLPYQAVFPELFKSSYPENQ